VSLTRLVEAPRARAGRPTVEEGRTFIESARRAQVVAAAIEVVAELGYLSASLARIAEHAGTSKGVVTYHFENKEDLVRAVYTEVLAQVEAFMRERIGAEGSASGMLRAYITANLEFMRDCRTQVVAILEIYWNARDEAGRPLYDLATLDAQVAPLESLLRAGQESGELGEFDASVMAFAIRGAIDAVPPRLARDPDFDVDAYIAVLSETFLAATSGQRHGAAKRRPAP
jgi:TetR/AcrR family transcriptional regulator, fatty acid metabolism regulator protein